MNWIFRKAFPSKLLLEFGTGFPSLSMRETLKIEIRKSSNKEDIWKAKLFYELANFFMILRGCLSQLIHVS
jgi:hypothetical protein